MTSSWQDSRAVVWPTSPSTIPTTSRWASYICADTLPQKLSIVSLRRWRFATANGKPRLYNETVTLAFLLLIRERMARTEGTQTWSEFAASNSDLPNWKDNILKNYYRDETLSSDLARTTFLFPNKTVLKP